MAERRRTKRTELESRLIIRRLDGGSAAGKEAMIRILDVSKTGVGFECAEPLQIGEIYEAYLMIWTKEVLHAFLQIVRIELKKGTYCYGATFVGMPELDAGRIETYQTITEMEQ